MPRKTRFVISIFENGKWRRTNWIATYKNNKLGCTIKTVENGYRATSNEDEAYAALLFARKNFPKEKYELKRA